MQQTAIELFHRIMAELTERLEAGLSTADTIAVATAVQTAVMEGARAGIVEMTARVSELEPELHVDLKMDTLRPVDTWAERYGDKG
jgi:hypothetical protein